MIYDTIAHCLLTDAQPVPVECPLANSLRLIAERDSKCYGISIWPHYPHCSLKLPVRLQQEWYQSLLSGDKWQDACKWSQIMLGRIRLDISKNIFTERVVKHCIGMPRKVWSPHPWRYWRDLWMCCAKGHGLVMGLSRSFKIKKILEIAIVSALN